MGLRGKNMGKKKTNKHSNFIIATITKVIQQGSTMKDDKKGRT
jgi:hypothetical protein